MTDIEKLKVVAFDVIRHEVRNFTRTTTDSEVGNYVRGVLDLFCKLMEDNQNNTIRERLIDEHQEVSK